jgi:hypothetical protein
MVKIWPKARVKNHVKDTLQFLIFKNNVALNHGRWKVLIALRL